MKQYVLFILSAVIAINAMAQYPEMVRIPGGTFQMGRNDEYAWGEKPVHTVTVSSFSMGKYEVTVAEYKAYCEATGRSMTDFRPPWGWKDKHPMVYVSYDDANAYCKWLSEATGKNYRLPTEAEWEYASRGGNNSSNAWAGSNDPDEVAWSDKNSKGQTQAVGRKKPNGYGLYDMSGNVWEWCSDWYDSDYYAVSPPRNPQGPASGKERVLRGGCWDDHVDACKVTNRSGLPPRFRERFIGFRVVLAE